jgi:hypothetical protein
MLGLVSVGGGVLGLVVVGVVVVGVVVVGVGAGVVVVGAGVVVVVGVMVVTGGARVALGVLWVGARCVLRCTTFVSPTLLGTTIALVTGTFTLTTRPLGSTRRTVS